MTIDSTAMTICFKVHHRLNLQDLMQQLQKVLATRDRRNVRMSTPPSPLPLVIA